VYIHRTVTIGDDVVEVERSSNSCNRNDLKKLSNDGAVVLTHIRPVTVLDFTCDGHTPWTRLFHDKICRIFRQMLLSSTIILQFLPCPA